METITQQLKVLLIEDDNDDYILVRNLLSAISASKFDLEWVDTYDEGLRRMTEGRHDVYLLDYRLGEKSGLELLTEAVGMGGCKAPIIFLTGQGNYRVEVEAMRAGAADYLVKGQIVSDALERSIRHAIERRHAEDALRKAHDELEMRVQERTLELARVNNELRIEIAERKEAGKAIQALVESTMGIIGEDYFYRIVSGLCEWLDCECAMIGEIVDHTVRMLSLQVDGAFVTSSAYALEGTPCEEVVRRGYRVYPEGVQALFPKSEELRDLGAVGYIGTPLRDKNNEAVGILWGISRHGLKVPQRAEDVMNILAAKAAAEIERLRMEADKERMEIQLRQARKMEAIGTLAGGIAHDFNNILAAIIGYTEIALDTIPEWNPARYDMKEVLKAGLRAKDLVRQILVFSRHRNEKERQPFDIGILIHEALKSLRPSLPSNIEIRRNISARHGMALVDPTQIHQVLINLCSNAAHAMKEKGDLLEVGLKSVDIDPDTAALHSGMKPGSYLRITVRDTGHGMDSAVVERIFDPYFTTKKTGEGCGLGLAVAQGIVKRHEGVITVHSEPEKGTTFQVYLPEIQEQSPKEGVPADVSVSGGTAEKARETGIGEVAMNPLSKKTLPH